MCAEKNIQPTAASASRGSTTHIYLKRAHARRGLRPRGHRCDVARLTGAASRVCTRSSCRPKPRRTAPRCARRAVLRFLEAEQLGSSSIPATRLHWPAGAPRCRRAARDRGGAPPLACVRRSTDRRLDHPDPHAVRRPRPAGALDPPQPEYQHTRCQLFSEPVPGPTPPACAPRPPRSTAVEGHRTEGVDHGAASATAVSPPCAPIPTSRSTTASRCW